MKDKLSNLIKYKSSEMVSATKLVRGSKSIFDALENKDLDKAVILRDGKPSFILMDLEEYENIISTCMNILENTNINKIEILKSKEKDIYIEDKSIKTINKSLNEDEKKSEILSKLDNISGVIINDGNKKDDKYKDFWE